MSNLVVQGYGDSHVGAVRDTNEDALIVDPKWGLYAVLDGMGGASAGDIAATKARDVVHEYVRARRSTLAPRQLLDAAINAASAAVHGEAQRRRDRRGMGTTVVACLIDGRRATIAHVGDSRAYLLRDGRLHRLTNDHTIVAELVARGAIAADEADRHAYKNVLSRNLGAKATAAVDLNEVELQAGDRLLLCSDGLYGYAASQALHQLMGAPDQAADVVRDLIDAALRGGGGDNVTAIVIDAGTQAMPRATAILRTSGAGAWWARRDRVLHAARAHGIHRSPLCAVLPPDDAIALVAGNFADAIYHDLEKSASVNVWTFAENLAVGWLGQGGAWAPLRELLDGLGRAADAVVAELRGEDVGLAGLIEAALARAMVTAETAVGGVLAQQLRTVEAELVRHAAERAKRDAEITSRFTDQPTVPFMRAAQPTDAPGPEVQHVLDGARRRALGRPAATNDRELFMRAIEHAHRVATAATDADATVAARELFDVRALDEAGVTPLYDALDAARAAHVDAVRAVPGGVGGKLAALRRAAGAYQRLSSTIAALVVESVAPTAEQLREAAAATAALRAQVTKNERKVASLERKFATIIDDDLPAGMRFDLGLDRKRAEPPPVPRRRPSKETLR
ncbi:MAG: protein phosphatase 2C domain-containing protein [Kofleriaceae bacterium]